MPEYGIPSFYLNRDVGGVVILGEEDIGWKPEVNWERIPIRIAKRTSTDPTGNHPYGYGYMYSKDKAFQDIAIHVIKDTNGTRPEQVYTTTLEYITDNTYFKSKTVSHEWFIEVCHDGYWMYLDKFRNLIESSRVFPRVPAKFTEKLIPVLYPGGFNKDELDEPLPPLPENVKVPRPVSYEVYDKVEIS